jgi:hypothetical protein
MYGKGTNAPAKNIKMESAEDFIARGGKVQKEFHREFARRKIYWKGDDLSDYYNYKVEQEAEVLEGAQYAGDIVATWRG